MRTISTVLLIAGFAATGLAGPPETEVRPVTEKIHGETVTDNYRWIEGDNSDPANMGKMTEEVATWTDSQNEYTRSILDNLPGRKALESRLRELMEVPSIGSPSVYGNRYFYSKREGAQPQSVLYVRDGLEGDDRVLLDPQVIDPTGLTTVSWTAPNKDGSLMAFGMYASGDENSTLYLLDVESGEWFADVIPGKVGFSQWLPDNSGFFYERLEDIDDAYSSVMKLHKIGTHHREDQVLFRQRDIGFFYDDLNKSEAEIEALKTTWGPFGIPSEDGRWMVVGYWTGTAGVDMWVADLDAWFRTGEFNMTPMAIGKMGRMGGAHFDGDRFIMQHSFDAPNGTVSSIDLTNPGFENWETVVAANDNLVIDGVSFARGIIAVDYLENAKTRIALYDFAGKSLGDLDLPGIGSGGLRVSDDRTDAFLSFSSYNMPRSIYHVDLATGERELWARPNVPVDPSTIEVSQVWYDSKDGTPVSMFLVHKKGIELNGKNPTILYGYGGFDISMTPYFSSTMFPWYENGGVYAVANLRGGGEYGNAWHEAGMLDQKQNVFDDFIAAGEWLIDNGYTNPQQLGIAGGSNGGLLTGATVVQRPDLFSAVITAVPLLDMVRYQNFLMARYWVPEYGTAEDPSQYEYIKKYSPYQNVKPGTKYPAVLYTAGENDTRVHPLHARKMAALMQASTGSDQEAEPIMLWVDRDAGHGGGKPLNLRIRDVADQRIFMMWQLGMFEE
ncbi:MAG: prolyl oligopeptidase family serine peptidase [Phycisphaerales bacterium]|nr:prolyl oligopeptidase family serine peptidase [Phycisphaerales bacterium]